LTVPALLERARQRDADGRPVVREIILATNPTMEGDGTALYLQSQLQGAGITITRLARGLPSGAQIEHANKTILSDALAGRTRR
ncbi:MAG: toprim domain-containing protein, partial [Planctomycetes bacterium]|nr:toprim domain-containing protein [Planctomycetota bacterium]